MQIARQLPPEMLKWIMLDTSAADQVQEGLELLTGVICNAYRAHASEVYCANMV